MSEKCVVRLADVADKLEEVTDHWEQFLNIRSGEFVALADGVYVDKDEALANEIDCSDDYVRLPNQYDINEFKIMVSFTDTLDNSDRRELLIRALRGKKPFRTFKDTLNYTGLAKDYYAHRSQALLDIAKAWLENNEISYI
jgi:hypothetical protein